MIHDTTNSPNVVNATITTEMVYMVMANTDSIEGRGRDVCIGYFLDGDMAKNFAKGKDVMGCDARITRTASPCVRLPNGEVRLLGDIVVTDSFIPELPSKEKIQEIEKAYNDLQELKKLREQKLNKKK